MGNIFVGNNQVKKIYKGSTLLAEVKEEQTKSVTLTSNGTTTITADSGKTMSSVTIVTNVPTSTEGYVPRGRAVWSRNNPSLAFTKKTVTYDESDGYYRCNPGTQPNFEVAVTYDGLIPEDDLSNVVAFIKWTAGQVFGINDYEPFTTTEHGDGFVIIAL